jgi:hypothetical protein
MQALDGRHLALVFIGSNRTLRFKIAGTVDKPDLSE